MLTVCRSMSEVVDLITKEAIIIHEEDVDL